jgi:hypothetical protein
LEQDVAPDSLTYSDLEQEGRRAEGQKVLITSPGLDEASAPDVRRAPRSGAHNPVVIGGLNRHGCPAERFTVPASLLNFCSSVQAPPAVLHTIRKRAGVPESPGLTDLIGSVTIDLHVHAPSSMHLWSCHTQPSARASAVIVREICAILGRSVLTEGALLLDH